MAPTSEKGRGGGAPERGNWPWHVRRGRPSNLGGPRHSEAGLENPPAEVGQRQGEPEPRPKVARKSEGFIGATTSANGWHRSRPSKRRPVSRGASGGQHGRCIDGGRHVTGTFEGNRESDARPAIELLLAGA